MKVSTAEPEAENVHPPLARDALGHLLALPEGTASWRISRHTAGRPRVLTGPDGTAMRFPLSTTAAELVDLSGPDTYRVYALDELGEVLDFVTTIQASRPRNANVPLASLKGAHDATPTTDLRFALHALTEIARINGEALRAISDSQADWIKTLAMNKGLPRNVAFPVLPPPREEPDDESDDEHSDAEDEADPNASPMMQFLSTVTPLIPGLVATWQGKKDEPAEPGESDEPPAPVTVNGMAHLARVQQQLTPRERAFLAALLADERGDSVGAELSVMPVEQVVALVREHCSKPPARPQSGEPTSKQLRDRVLALLPRLSPATQMRLMALAPKVSVASQVPPELRRMLGQLARLDDAGAIAWLEANLDDLERASAS